MYEVITMSDQSFQEKLLQGAGKQLAQLKPWKYFQADDILVLQSNGNLQKAHVSFFSQTYYQSLNEEKFKYSLRIYPGYSGKNNLFRDRCPQLSERYKEYTEEYMECFWFVKDDELSEDGVYYQVSRLNQFPDEMEIYEMQVLFDYLILIGEAVEQLIEQNFYGGPENKMYSYSAGNFPWNVLAGCRDVEKCLQIYHTPENSRSIRREPLPLEDFCMEGKFYITPKEKKMLLSAEKRESSLEIDITFDEFWSAFNLNKKGKKDGPIIISLKENEKVIDMKRKWDERDAQQALIEMLEKYILEKGVPACIIVNNPVTKGALIELCKILKIDLDNI